MNDNGVAHNPCRKSANRLARGSEAEQSSHWFVVSGARGACCHCTCRVLRLFINDVQLKTFCLYEDQFLNEISAGFWNWTRYEVTKRSSVLFVASGYPNPCHL